jgi:asparagine synthase (glutamine-hydrolysing)
MCGIAGFFEKAEKYDRMELHSVCKKMIASISHRGPDGDGIWQDPDIPVVLGHKRLSIIDLSNLGAQPMVSNNDRFIISYNGEIYNFLSIKKELEVLGTIFRGNSDTEVILAAFESWGIQEALKKLNGMFAIAVWDRQKRQLHLIRDRMGKKPLYFGWAGSLLCFGSELKVFMALKDFEKKIDKGALSLFMRYGHVPAPYSIFENVWQLPQGCFITLDVGFIQKGVDLRALIKPYWKQADVVKSAIEKRDEKSDDEIEEEFLSLLSDAVKLRMISDVPLGAFLSGGIDSSMIVSLMQQYSVNPVKTFSIGFEEAGFNEAVYASKVAKHLGTDHHELYVSSKEALNVIPDLPDIYDEPFADVSQIPTHLVSKFSKQHVTVALSGDGGDEMLGGYNRHFMVPSLWRRVGWMPNAIRKKLGERLLKITTERWDKLVPSHPQFGDRMHKAASMISKESKEDAYFSLLEYWENSDALVLEGRAYNEIPLKQQAWIPEDLSFEDKIIYSDALSYLPNDILTKVDRASMAVSLETRAPLLDYRVFEFCWSLPYQQKVRHNKGKWLLRKTLSRYIPDELINRPKQGFAVPVGEWLKGPLKEWAAELLSESNINNEGLLNYGLIDDVWNKHLNGEANYSNQLWSVLMFEAWLARWCK